MARSCQRRKPSFLWQTLLILFPVGVLAAVGFLSLRRDKTLAQHEATERAQVIADELLPRLWLALTNAGQEAFEHHAFQTDAAGELLFPPPLSLTPSPEPLTLGDLSANQASLWQQSERVEVSDKDSPAAIEAVRAFLKTQPPERFAAIATYDLAILLSKQGQPQVAAETLLSLLDRYARAVAASGLPLNRLAEFKLLQLSASLTNHPPEKSLISADDFCRRIVYDPSPLTASFLAWIAAHASAVGAGDSIEKWNHLWQEHEQSRRLFVIATRNSSYNKDYRSSSLGTNVPQLFWFNSDDQNWLAIRFDENSYPPDGKKIYGNGATPLKTHESVARLHSEMDLQPERAKNRLMSPQFSAPAVESGDIPFTQQRSEISHNWPAGYRTPRSAKSFYGGGIPQKNVVSPEFNGPAINSTMSNATWVLCRNESELSQSLFSILKTNAQVPEYFGIALEIAGKRLREGAPDLRLWRESGWFEGGGAKGRKIDLPISATNVLASAFYSSYGVDLLRANVYLTSPATLFQRQSDRTFWFGSLVAISALAAFVGLFSAWRAFNRQQELAEMKSNFVSSVSHELRAPIASVRLMAESLERGKISEIPKQQEYFRFIGQECRRLSSLIENVLDFSRIEQGRKQYDFEPTDLIALLQQTVKLMEAYGVERQVSIILKLPDHQLSILDYQLSLDGRAIQQAVINLLDNAIKHSPNGQTITVLLEFLNSDHASRPASAGHHKSLIRISVQDNGPGIPAEEHEKIFERFYRLGSELRRETQGVGIGLSIVKHIVEAHGGRVLVQSTPGHGSQFTIELPVTSPQKDSVK